MSNMGYSNVGMSALKFVSVGVDENSGEFFTVKWANGVEQRSLVGYTRQAVEAEAGQLLAAKNELELELTQLKQATESATSLVEVSKLLQSKLDKQSKQLSEMNDLIAMLFDVVEGQKDGNSSNSRQIYDEKGSGGGD